MSKDRIHELLLKLFSGECTPEEENELALWIESFQNEEEWTRQLKAVWEEYESKEEMEEDRAEAIFERIIRRKERSFSQRKHLYMNRRMIRWAVAAAAVGMLLAFSIRSLFPEQGSDKVNLVNQEKAGGIVPGGNKATLTISGGKTIILDSSQKGLLAQNGGSSVVKMAGGVLKFQRKKKENSSVPSYNTIMTPRGGQYQVILPDGSKIWMNASSSLKFPSVFSTKKRTITIKGEVFAEIAKDENRPFYVNVISEDGTSKGKIKVLGTQFNINAYPENRRVKTALLSGRILVEKADQSKLLHPGERAFIKDRQIDVRKEKNIDQIISWKSGKFNFEGYDIRHVMQQISRWYDVKINYDYVPTDHFVGTISRGANISEVLKILEMTDVVHFKVQGRTVIVTR